MQIFINSFFIIFFIVSIGGIMTKIYLLCQKQKNISIELYCDEEINIESKKLKNLYANRLSNESVRSSVRYHKGKFKSKEAYEKYKIEIKHLELP